MNRLLPIVCLLAIITPCLAQDDGWTSLMPTVPDGVWTENGKPVGGWVKWGGDAVYRMENGEIVGTRGPGANTFLCTEKRHRNFAFKAEFKYDIDCNSGIQFRSNTRPEGERTRVFGYQCEIMETPGNNANIYDEGRRGRWLEELTDDQKKAVQAAYRKGEWNALAVQCIGPSIKTWLNGTPVTNLIDLETAEGFFGLQVHAGEKGQVRWRNIRMKEFPDTPWQPLYAEGRMTDLAAKPVGTWEVQEDGSIRGTTPAGEKNDGMLLSTKRYKDFAVKVTFKRVAGNSGLYFRASEVDQSYWLKGFQCEIEAGAPCAGLWEVEGRGWVAKNEELAAKNYKEGAWNTISTVAIGDRIVTHLNGQRIVDIIDPKCAKEGLTGLQLHGGGDQGYFFKEYEIMPLDEAAVQMIAR